MRVVKRISFLVLLSTAALSGCTTVMQPASSGEPHAQLKTYSKGPVGLKDDRLAPCGPVKCLTSDATVTPESGLQPFSFLEQSPEYVWFSLRESVIALRGDITRDTTVYLAAEFRDRSGYVDDLEIRVDWRRRLLHFRTATRVGSDDINLLRDRIELLRKALAARLSHPR